MTSQESQGDGNPETGPPGIGQQVVPRAQTQSTTFGPLLPELWVRIGELCEESESTKDIAALAMTSQAMHGLLFLTWSKQATKRDMLIPWERSTRLVEAIAQGRPLEEIAPIARFYANYPNCDPSTTRIHTPPAMHFAAYFQRIDVVNLLTELGYNINVRWGGRWTECSNRPHHKCIQDRFMEHPSCRNALDIARAQGADSMVDCLIEKGIEFLGSYARFTNHGLFDLNFEFSDFQPRVLIMPPGHETIVEDVTDASDDEASELDTDQEVQQLSTEGSAE
ncbi:hypothetical protein GGR50DRAFT_218139 [Xylaria sp. CBS 124048]|nr:hypothetical protein GGR50DRAFT_218139 [Xylaria sp. CBS 124048]